MKYRWLNKQNNEKLVLIFNGWGMNETPFGHLDFQDYDVMLVQDYRELDFKWPDFSKYKEKNLICWSMGVYVSGVFKNILNNFDRKIALNGTGAIIDNNFGIPEKIFKLTVKFLNEESLDKFIKNMFDGGKLNPEITITRNLSELKEELIKINNLKITDMVDFNCALISDNDKIIPTKNQINFWDGKTRYKMIPSTHCPFNLYKNIGEIICS